VHTHQRNRHFFGAVLFQKGRHHGLLVITDLGLERRISHQPLVIAGQDLVRRRWAGPGSGNAGIRKQPLRAAAGVVGNDQRRNALAAGAAGAARPVQQSFRCLRQVGMNDQFQIGQVETAGGDIGCNANLRPAIAQGLKSVGAFVLAQLARQRDDRETTVGKPGGQVIDGGAGAAEDDRILGIVIAQDIDDGIFAVIGSHRKRPVLNVEMLFLVTRSGHSNRLVLVTLGKIGDAGWHGCRKHQRAALVRCGIKDELQIVTKAEIKHFIGFIEHHGADGRQIERPAFDMIAQPARGSHNDVGAAFKRAAFSHHVHAADTGGDPGTRLAV
jgi:hypothetical protein